MYKLNIKKSEEEKKGQHRKTLNIFHPKMEI